MAIMSFREWRNKEVASSEKSFFAKLKLYGIYLVGMLFSLLIEVVLPSLPRTEQKIRTVDEIAGGLIDKPSPSESSAPPTQVPPLDKAEPLAIAQAPPGNQARTDSNALPVTVSLAPATEAFLNEMKEATRNESEDAARELQRLRGQDNRIFIALLGSGVATIVLVLVGVGLLFQKSIAFGVVSEVIGLLPGSGTLILRRMAEKNQRQLDQVTNARKDNLTMLRAIQAAQLIEDPVQRSDAITSIATDLRERALSRRRSASRR